MDAHGIEAKETTPASKKLGRKEAAELAKAASKVVVAKGKKVSEFKPAGKASDEIVEAMLGPTGNLRAPTLRKGKTVIVGFNDEVFEKVFS
jgi:arsenate reductase-like glutaredoxin family protein